jgi:hypothetical protein
MRTFEGVLPFYTENRASSELPLEIAYSSKAEWNASTSSAFVGTHTAVVVVRAEALTSRSSLPQPQRVSAMSAAMCSAPQCLRSRQHEVVSPAPTANQNQSVHNYAICAKTQNSSATFRVEDIVSKEQAQQTCASANATLAFHVIYRRLLENATQPVLAQTRCPTRNAAVACHADTFALPSLYPALDPWDRQRPVFVLTGTLQTLRLAALKNLKIDSSGFVGNITDVRVRVTVYFLDQIDTCVSSFEHTHAIASTALVATEQVSPILFGVSDTNGSVSFAATFNTSVEKSMFALQIKRVTTRFNETLQKYLNETRAKKNSSLWSIGNIANDTDSDSDSDSGSSHERDLILIILVALLAAVVLSLLLVSFCLARLGDHLVLSGDSSSSSSSSSSTDTSDKKKTKKRAKFSLRKRKNPEPEAVSEEK